MEINIRRVFHNKNPKLARLIPGFVFNYIEHIAHQDGLNEILRTYGQQTGVDFAASCMDYFNVSIDIKGLENVPEGRRYLFVSNHPLGGFDGIILMVLIGKKLGDVRVLVNDLLMNIENLRPLFLPINKHGGHSKDAAKAIDETFETDVPMLTFPAGICSRKVKGVVTDLEWKKNFLHKAIEHKRDIVPIYFNGRNSNFFYNLANLRKRLGIKSNIEMFFLVDELFKHRNKTFQVTFGKPISYSVFTKELTLPEWSENIKRHVYKLKDKVNIGFEKYANF
jgi:putative hemolysin